MECAKCGGTGKVEEPIQLAARLRRLRVRAGLKQRAMAARLKISQAFLSDMEAGRRGWSVERVKEFEKICIKTFVGTGKGEGG